MMMVWWSFMPPSSSFSLITIHCEKVTTSLFWTIFLCCTAHWIKLESYCSKRQSLVSSIVCLFVWWTFMPPSSSFSLITIHCEKVTTSLFWTIFLCCTAHWIKPERFCSKNKVLFLQLFVCLFVCLFGWLVIPHASLLVIQSNYHSVCESDDFSILNDFFV